MKLVITPHRPVRKALITLGITLVVVFALLMALDYGRWKSTAQTMISIGKKRSLLEEVVGLRRENDEIRYEMTRLRRTAEVNEHARKDHHSELVRLETQIASLTKEIEFYRDAIGAAEVDNGPQVRGVQFKALEGEGRFSYKLVMTHVSKDNLTTEGSLQMDVSGEMKGQRKAVGFGDIVESGPESLGFKFKHFYLFEGTVRIPPGFVPRQIHIAVRESARRQNAHEQTYDWASVLN